MPSRPRVLLVSEVLPGHRNAGGLILARHLQDYPHVLAIDPFATPGALCATAPVEPSRLWRFARREPPSRLARLMELTGMIRPCRCSAAARVLAAFRPDVLLAVAHGETAFLAARLARHARLPLVLIFHDWWPDFVPTRFRSILDIRYRRLFRQCDAALCVSEGFHHMLGPHRRAIVLPPLPSEPPDTKSTPAATVPFELHYYGNMTGCYRNPLVSLLRSLDNASWRALLTGAVDDWTAEERDLATRVGGFLGYLSEDKLNELRLRAGAFLVVLSFFEGDRRRVKTSFPSKLVEYCQTPRPIVIWGPAESAAAEWARRTGAALLVDRPNPSELIQAVERLVHDRHRCDELITAARDQAATELSPRHIRQVFDTVLEDPAGSGRIVR